MSHRLDPLLRPRSIAVVGATERAHSVGRRTLHNLLAGGYEGQLYPVNPGRETVLGLPCFPDLASLPETVDHVTFAVSDRNIESALNDAVEHGARAVTLMSQLILPDDHEPRLQERVESMVEEAGLLVCGANAMGFYNCHDGVWLCGFDTREDHPRGGNVTLISHSGSGMAGIVDCEGRIDFNLAVSAGQEINVCMHDYMDFAIEAHAPRVIGLFMETVRAPEALIAALEKARRAKIPIVAIKVGRTKLSARLAESHSGAIAGEDAAYAALFERYGVQRVHDMDEFATALMMFAQPHAVADGGLVAIHDSGGERQLLIDLAVDTRTPLADINPDTERALEGLLDPGLPAVNPLDAWGAGGPEADRIMQDCLAALMCDPAAAMGAVVHDRGPDSAIYEEYVEYLRAGHAASGKPAFLVSNRQGSGADPRAIEVTRAGFPVIDGLRSFLAGVNCLLGYRDFQARRPTTAPRIPAAAARRAREILADNPGEANAMRLLDAVGLPAIPCREAENLEAALAITDSLGFPVVLKTASPGALHKTELGGVHLGLANEDAVAAAYQDLAERLGPRVLVAPMVAGGLEMTLGMVHDSQFGPLVLMGFGGVQLEALKDVVYAIPPFDAATAERQCRGLKQQALLTFDRGYGRPAMDAFYGAAALFSALVAELGDAICEIDINPLVVMTDGCVAVDALVISNGTAGKHAKSRKAS